MVVLNVLSAGAAQSVVQKVIADVRAARGIAVEAAFGAVGAMKARALDGNNGAPLDVIVLTDVMIDELIASGFVAPVRFDLGKVGTGVAVRAGAARPDVGSAGALRASLRAASVIVFPDPAIATAGKIVMACLEELGVANELTSRLKLFPNGNAAMNWMAANGDARCIGITQNTEILPIAGVSYVGPLPEAFQARATYAAGRVAATPHPAEAADFIARLTSPDARPMLAAAGYEF